jgi:acetate kinase
LIAPTRSILCLNSGSSSLKFAFFSMRDSTEERLGDGAVESIGLPGGRIWFRDASGARLLDQERPFGTHREALDAFLNSAMWDRVPRPEAAGNRVVHGGPSHIRPELVNPPLLRALRDLIPLAPLHLPSAIEVMEILAKARPDLPQVACYDTAFHRTMPELTQRFPLPRGLWDDGVRRYGFHGLSYEYIVGALGPDAAKPTIIAHLGNGASAAAVRDGQCVDTTMGLTPTGGFMMGTRCGDLDPGVLIYLIEEKGLDSAQLRRLLNDQSGLLGVSELSRDMKTLLQAEAADPRAAQAVDMFCLSIRKHIGALAASLGGVQQIVFTGGIGEHGAEIRQRICAGLGHLGVTLDAQRNARHADYISGPQSSCAVRVIPTNEDLVIARHTRRVVFNNGI